MSEGRRAADQKLLLDPELIGAARGPESGPLLEAVEIHKRYGRNEVLRGVTFEVDRGEPIPGCTVELPASTLAS